MEKNNARLAPITDSIQNLNLSSKSKSIRTSNLYSKEISTAAQSSGVHLHRAKPPSLVSLCLGVVGKHLEEIIADLEDVAVNFPSDIKAAVAAIARRRKLLDDNVILYLADSSWEILDLSSSDVSDIGLTKLAGICKFLRAVDISRCEKITAAGVYEVVRQCRSLETLRCGGCPRSDYTARSCLGMLKPHLNDVESDLWEELDATDIVLLNISSLIIGNQYHLLRPDGNRWVFWDAYQIQCFCCVKTNKCIILSENRHRVYGESINPRIVVNPKASVFGYKGDELPREALPDIILDDPYGKEIIDPKTWAACGPRPRRTVSPTPSSELSIAEKFRLAFVERDIRMAPKRAKNGRPNEREWVTMDTSAKAIALASRLMNTKNLYEDVNVFAPLIVLISLLG